MKESSRREFVKMGAATVAAAGAGPLFAQAPTVMARKSAPPVVISSENGNQFKNGGPRTCVEEAFLRLTRGEDVLDALMAGGDNVGPGPPPGSGGCRGRASAA